MESYFPLVHDSPENNRFSAIHTVFHPVSWPHIQISFKIEFLAHLTMGFDEASRTMCILSAGGFIFGHMSDLVNASFKDFFCHAGHLDWYG